MVLCHLSASAGTVVLWHLRGWPSSHQSPFGFNEFDACFHSSAQWSIHRVCWRSPSLPKGRSKNLILNHFNLHAQPFGVTPDPGYLYYTPTHREALAGLLYGIESGLGFIALTAEPGMGKTTILIEAL